jgi:hypothetical protein
MGDERRKRLEHENEALALFDGLTFQACSPIRVVRGLHHKPEA